MPQPDDTSTNKGLAPRLVPVVIREVVRCDIEQLAHRTGLKVPYLSDRNRQELANLFMTAVAMAIARDERTNFLSQGIDKP